MERRPQENKGKQKQEEGQR